MAGQPSALRRKNDLPYHFFPPPILSRTHLLPLCFDTLSPTPAVENLYLLVFSYDTGRV